MSDVQLPLFDLGPTAEERAALPVHVLMPCMAFACGVGVLDGKHSGFRLGVYHDEEWEQVTCPDCRAIGREEIRAEQWAQQHR